jgi:molybdate transport system substrate-binding protein
VKVRHLTLSTAALALVLATGVGNAVAAPSASPAPTPPVTGTITVAAASSLVNVFPVIATAFEKRYPGTDVRFSFAGSATLVSQVIAGAPVDVLATAAELNMATADNAGKVGTPLLFAKNTMMIATPKGNPAHITSVNDLSRPGLKIGICAANQPCGAAARQVFANAGISVTPATLTPDVRTLLNQVISGDLDAGIVYVTDVKSEPTGVTGVAIPTSINATTTYPIATVNHAPNAAAAAAFVNYVRFTRSAQGILRAYGFARPWL